jgi:hypothetical protein
MLGYMRTVSKGSPIDRRWWVPGQILSQLRHGKTHAPKDSPLTLQDVLASEDYRDLSTAEVVEGDLAPDFELPLLGREDTVRLSALLEERPVALVFGSYT